MKNIQYKLLVLFLFATLAVFAEEDSTLIKRNITIEKEYVPVIKDAGKVNVIPSVVEANLPKIDVTYSSFSILMDPAYEIKRLDAARLSVPPLPERKDGFLRLAMGNYWSTNADLLCPLLNKPTYRWDLNVNHLGAFSDKMHHKTNFGTSVHRYYETGVFLLDGAYGFEGYNYYGRNALISSLPYTKGTDSLAGTDFFNKDAAISFWNMSMGYNSIPAVDKPQSFSMKFKYEGMAPNVGLKEHAFTTSAKWDSKLEENNAGVNFEMQNLAYNSSDVVYAPSQKGYTIVRLNPYYDFNEDRWNLHVGANIDFAGGAGKTFVPSADIKGLATLVDKTLFMYGNITGNIEANTMRKTVELNRYVNLNEKLENTYTPFDMTAGFKLKLLSNFITDIYLGYKKINNQYFFVNQLLNDSSSIPTLSNVHTAHYSDAGLFNAGVKLNYNFNQQFGFVFGWKYNKWSVDTETAWQMPKNEFDFGVDMKLTKRTSVNLYSYFASGRKAMAADGSAISMKSIADINMGFFYAHSSKVSAFLKLNNIIHQKYDQWYGYDVNGFNAMFGLVFAF